MNPLEIVMPVCTALGDSEWTLMMAEIPLNERYDGDLNDWPDYKKPNKLNYKPTKIQLDYPQKIVNIRVYISFLNVLNIKTVQFQFKVYNKVAYIC
ncbi:hypothetical protein OCE25_28595 [Bacillus cereus]|nr:hypothetical protein [Bacillus cereus]